MADAMNLKSRKSCGSYPKHGLVGSLTYRSWKSMKQRCFNHKNPKFADYGGRGISVCERWKDSFPNFVADMGEAPPGHTIERVDNNGDYKPGNCVWATRKAQARNRRAARVLTIGRESKCLVEWSEQAWAAPYRAIMARLNYGWPHELAVFAPKGFRLHEFRMRKGLCAGGPDRSR